MFMWFIQDYRERLKGTGELSIFSTTEISVSIPDTTKKCYVFSNPSKWVMPYNDRAKHSQALLQWHYCSAKPVGRSFWRVSSHVCGS